MPTYDYQCSACGKGFEFKVPMVNRDLPVQCDCEHHGLAWRQFSPNPNVMIPLRFGLSRTWHMTEQGSSEHGMVGNNSQTHSPQR